MDDTRLRGNSPRRRGPYPLGEIPDAVLMQVGKQIVHRLAVGFRDIDGNDFGNILARAVDGVHRSSPLGIADVVWDGCAWSCKTVQKPRPFKSPPLRLISGRNSPDYSSGIENPRENIERTGRAVLSIWNARVDEALAEHDDLRIAVLVRNTATREFVLFEEEAQRFVPDNYEWSYSKRKNLVGHEKATNTHTFTWQFHGGQFSIYRSVPPSARRFVIEPDVPTVDPEIVLNEIEFRDDWVKIVQ